MSILAGPRGSPFWAWRLRFFMWPTSCWRFTGRCAGDRSPCWLLFAALLGLGHVSKFFRPELSRRYEQPRETGTLRVLSYNVEGFFGKDSLGKRENQMKRIVRFIADTDPRYLLPAGVRVQSGQYAGQPRVGTSGSGSTGRFFSTARPTVGTGEDWPCSASTA